MHLKMCRSKHVLVLSPLEISEYKDSHPKALSSARAPASQRCASTVVPWALRVVDVNGETSSVCSLGGSLEEESRRCQHTRLLCFAPRCLVNWWFTKNAPGSEPSKLAVIGREQLMAGLTEHHLTKALPHSVDFPHGKDPSLRDSLHWGGSLLNGCSALSKGS